MTVVNHLAHQQDKLHLLHVLKSLLLYEELYPAFQTKITKDLATKEVTEATKRSITLD